MSIVSVNKQKVKVCLVKVAETSILKWNYIVLWEFYRCFLLCEQQIETIYQENALKKCLE